MHIVSAIIFAAEFLSRLPLRGLSERLSSPGKGVGFEVTARYFGIAALLISLPSALVVLVASALGLSSAIVATLAIITHVLTTGALHEDALADVADGFGGGKTKIDKLRIMRDHQIGTYGASALILSFLLLAMIYTDLLGQLGTDGFVLVLIAANSVSTALMVWPWAELPPARSEGGLSSKLGVPDRKTAVFALWLALPLAFLLLWIAASLTAAVLAILASVATMLAFSALSKNQIGGHTGDTLGATKKICELALLLVLLMAT